MDPPSKRLKPSPPPSTAEEDFVSLSVNDNETKPFTNNDYGYNASTKEPPTNVPRGPRQSHSNGQSNRLSYLHNPWYMRRHAQDRPRAKHALPGHEPWVLVETQFGRRFVHNLETKQSLWKIPEGVWPGVRDFDREERLMKERADNAKWAEEQLGEMRKGAPAVENGRVTGDERNAERSQRRRSESLQREDEEAMMAELSAEAERAEENDVKDVVKNLEGVKPQTAQGAGEGGYDSDSSYEEVEVTDSEFEDDGGEVGPTGIVDMADAPQDPPRDEGPVEFGEDDIAYQLAAMGEDYGLEPGDYGSDTNQDWEEGAEGLPLSEEDATNLFHDLLDDQHISPFTPWEKLIADDSPLLHDDRWTLPGSARARKAAWESWAKSRAATLQAERARLEKRNPRIPYLALLAAHATPKLYWPEFKRKFRKEAAMLDRHLSDKDRERLYREHVTRVKSSERDREAELRALLASVPLAALNRYTALDALPEAVLADGRYIGLPASQRDRVIEAHIATLAAAPAELEDGEHGEEGPGKKRENRLRREEALAARRREVEERERQAEMELRRARRGLREEERALDSAMRVDGRKGLRENLFGGAGKTNEGGGEG